MLPQSSVGQMDREIQTRPLAERQSQLLLSTYCRVCAQQSMLTHPPSAVYMYK